MSNIEKVDHILFLLLLSIFLFFTNLMGKCDGLININILHLIYLHGFLLEHK